MTEIALTGLPGHVPIGLLAALGAWRTAERLWSGTKLSWRATAAGSYCPVLHVGSGVDVAGLAQEFTALIRGWTERPEWSWAAQVKSEDPKTFIEAEERVEPDWLACMASDLVDKDGRLESTPFDMTVARQKFLDDAKWLHDELRKPSKRGDETLASFQEALFGPWRYRDNQHHLGWDPSTMLLGAFTEEAPTNLKKAGVRAAVWLAMEGLPLFPCCCVNRRLGTRGFQRFERRLHFTWPVWTAALSMRVAGSVLGLADLQVPVDCLDRTGLRARGIVAAYRSLQFKPNKYLSSFQPAERLM